MIQEISGMLSGLKTDLNMTQATQFLSDMLSKVRDWCKNITENIRDFIQSSLRKPTKKEDYVKLGSKYISKKMVLLGGVLIVAGVFATATYVYPWADGRIWRTSLEYGSEKYKTFSGMARIHSNGKTIYIGDMKEGQLSGKGKQFDENGKLVYEGNFETDMYSGEGILYNQGVMVYKGNFSKNLFDGEGEQYNSEGKLQYKGDFKLGQRSGNGIEYDIETAKKIYSGVWAENLREGEGIEFKNDGVTKIYKGAFSAGLYDGNGSLYENGKLKYQGEFSSGVYEGEGTLYDIDTGNVIYVGAFAGGKYEGEGKLFDVNTKKVVYSGNFSAGMREGEGESYDKLGAATYKGEFSEDDMAYFNYFGKKFDEISSEFGRESFKSAVEDKLIVTYRNKNISMLFKENAEDKSYTCEKIFVNLKNTTFKGLSNKSSQEEIKNLMGNVYSSIDYKFDSTYDALFQSLAVDIKSGVSYPSDKFIMENYFVRFYYDTNREKILSVEISLV